MPGFRRALELGAEAIELDVHLTADGVVVVHHDPVLRALPSDLPGTPLAIRELPAHALRDRPLEPGVPIPSLSDVLDLVADRAVVYVEVKALEAETATLQCIRAGRTRCAVHAFDHRVALRAATLAPGLPTGILLDSYLITPEAALRSAHARDYWQRWELIDADLVARVHSAGGRVIAWTVNDPGAARALQALGVDGICTDVCGTLLAP